jgi:hypothetical protein
MDNVQQKLTRIDKKINIIGSLVIGFSSFFTLIIIVEITKTYVQAPWNLILTMVLAFLSSALTIYMSIKFKEAGKSGG